MLVRGSQNTLLILMRTTEMGANQQLIEPNKPKRNARNACSLSKSIFHICTDANIVNICGFRWKTSNFLLSFLVFLLLLLWTIKLVAWYFDFSLSRSGRLCLLHFRVNATVFFYNGYSLFTVYCTDKDIVVVELRTIYWNRKDKNGTKN